MMILFSILKVLPNFCQIYLMIVVKRLQMQQINEAERLLSDNPADDPNLSHDELLQMQVQLLKIRTQIVKFVMLRFIPVLTNFFFGVVFTPIVGLFEEGSPQFETYDLFLSYLVLVLDLANTCCNSLVFVVLV